jgi:serine/threonine-protein kinase
MLSLYGLRVGDLVDGKYRIIAQTGRGGMSTVWLALNEKVNKQWAIKEVKKSSSSTSDQIIKQNLVTEAGILRHLKHPHLPSIVDIFDRDDSFLIVMDYIEGRTLSDILKEQGRQPQADVVDWALQICSVFKYLHGLNPPIIYRDMKPGNVMLKPDGNIMVIDFGTAREYKHQSSEDTIHLGTKGYAAPEQFQDNHQQTDPRTDIYNLGATMYHLVTGKNPSKPPFKFLPIRQVDRTLSSGLESIILKCVAPDPNERYQTVDDLEFALEHYQELEVETIKQKSAAYRKWVTLGCVATILSSLSVGVRIYANSLLSNTYDEELRSARIAVNQDEQIEDYISAIKLNPSNEVAYEELLEDVFLKDGNFTQEEASRLTSVVGYKQGSKTIQDIFKETNQSGYENFAYKMGLAYFYYYENDGNKQLSKPWFEIAKDSTTIEEKEKERAKKFYQIADYYIQSGNINKAGDADVDYKDFYKQLIEVSTGDIAKKDNVKTALVVYRELTFQLNVNGLNFYNAGIKIEDIESQLDTISDKAKALKSENLKEDEKEMLSEIMSNIEATRKNLSTVYFDRSNQKESQ